MTECLELVNTATRLLVGIVAGADCAHGCGFVASVGLGRVLKVRVRAARAVDADVAREGDVRAAVRFAHYGHDGYAG